MHLARLSQVSQGIAIGHAHLVSHATLEVAHYTVRERDIPREIERFEAALAAVRTDLGALHAEACSPARRANCRRS